VLYLHIYIVCNNTILTRHPKLMFMKHATQPSETMFEPFKEFCDSMSIPVLIVPVGFDLSPPQSNSKDRDDDDDDVLSSISTLLEDEDDSAAATLIIDDETDSWG